MINSGMPHTLSHVAPIVNSSNNLNNNNNHLLSATAAVPEPTAVAKHQDQLRGAVNATFRAIASPQAANVGPVAMSELARRRAKDKVTHTHL